METIISLYGKGNQIISWCLFYVGLYLVWSDNCHCTCCRCQNMLQWFGPVRSTMTTFASVWKLSWVMTISICLSVWRRKRWEACIYMWAPFFDAITAMVFWNVSWAIMCSLPQEQCSKWIPKSSMVSPHMIVSIMSNVIERVPTIHHASWFHHFEGGLFKMS